MDTTPLPTPPDRVHVRARESSSQRRELLRRYKQTPPPMGVYVIRNLHSGRCWLNASLNLDGAINRDRFELFRHAHRNRELQQDWQRLGAEQFRFEVLDTLKPRDEPGIDYRSELDDLLQMWREEMA